MSHPTPDEIDAAAMKPFAADLKGMSLAEKKNALQFSQETVDEEMPWIEALSASNRAEEAALKASQ